MSRRIRYQVASSLDGYIAGPEGEYDWIVEEPEIDFDALFHEFDTLLMGRRTYEVAGSAFPGKEVVVFSRTLHAAEHPDVTVVADGVREAVESIRDRPGKDIWLYGGGELFRSLLELDLVDTVEVAVIPVLLGEGRPLLPGPGILQRLVLTRHRAYETSGIVMLDYQVVRP